VRFVEVDEAKALVRDLYEQALPTRVGMLYRQEEWWAHRIFADPESWRDGMSTHRYIVAEEGGVATGYATFRQKAKWEGFVAEGQIRVEELIALTPAAHTALWAFLTNIDLFPKLEYWNAPVDDPLPFKVKDHRRVGRRLNDALYLRVMDVVAALEARTYETDGRILIGVDDRTRPAVSGTYLLEVEQGSGSCERVDADAEVMLAADVLGHLYLGGGDALGMAAAGRIGGDPVVVRRLHRIFRTDAPPWCSEVF
jgi:predicted acetyltransferase